MAARPGALVEAVRELREPYRTAILLRFWEGLSPEQIARRTGVTTRAVHSRLYRGLALLRERLATRDRRWMTALAALGGRGETWMPLGGALAMQTKVKLALGAAGILGALAWTQWPASVRPSSVAPEAALAEQDEVLMPATWDAQRDGRALSELAPEHVDGDALEYPLEVLALERENAPLRGRVVDTSGVPIAAVPVVISEFGTTRAQIEELALSEALATDAQGWFTVEQPSAWRQRRERSGLGHGAPAAPARPGQGATRGAGRGRGSAGRLRGARRERRRTADPRRARCAAGPGLAALRSR